MGRRAENDAFCCASRHGTTTDYATGSFRWKRQPGNHGARDHFHNDSPRRDLARTGSHNCDSRGDDSASIHHRSSDTNYNQGSRRWHHYGTRTHTRVIYADKFCARHYDKLCHFKYAGNSSKHEPYGHSVRECGGCECSHWRKHERQHGCCRRRIGEWRQHQQRE